MWRIFWLLIGTVLVEVFVAPIGGRIFDWLFPQSRPVAEMMPKLDWYHTGYATALVLGIGIGAMVAHWFPQWLGWARRRKATRPDTRLRLQLDPAGSKSYLELSKGNISNWQQVIVEANVEGETKFHDDTIGIGFEIPVKYESLIIETFGQKLPGYRAFFFWKVRRHVAVLWRTASEHD